MRLRLRLHLRLLTRCRRKSGDQHRLCAARRTAHRHIWTCPKRSLSELPIPLSLSLFVPPPNISLSLSMQMAGAVRRLTSSSLHIHHRRARSVGCKPAAAIGCVRVRAGRHALVPTVRWHIAPTTTAAMSRGRGVKHGEWTGRTARRLLLRRLLRVIGRRREWRFVRVWAVVAARAMAGAIECVTPTNARPCKRSG